MQNPRPSNESGAQQPEPQPPEPSKTIDKTTIIVIAGFVIGLGLLIALNMK